MNIWKNEYEMGYKIEAASERAKAEGKAEAYEEARVETAEKIRQEKLTIARKALAKGYTPESIHEITGLSLDEIAKL